MKTGLCIKCGAEDSLGLAGSLIQWKNGVVVAMAHRACGSRCAVVTTGEHIQSRTQPRRERSGKWGNRMKMNR